MFPFGNIGLIKVNFSSTHSIFTNLGFPESSPQEEETRVAHDDHDAISPALETSGVAKTAPNACIFSLHPYIYSFICNMFSPSQ